MESFFLAETLKYMYLLFDTNHFIHNNGSQGEVIQTTYGECVIDAGGYVFNTEGHPIDMAAVHCCSAVRKKDDDILFDLHDNLNLLSLFGATDDVDQYRGQKWEKKKKDEDSQQSSSKSKEDSKPLIIEDLKEDSKNSSSGVTNASNPAEVKDSSSEKTEEKTQEKESSKLNGSKQYNLSSSTTTNQEMEISDKVPEIEPSPPVATVNMTMLKGPPEGYPNQETPTETPTISDTTPNIVDLYKSLGDFKIDFKAPFAMMTCPAQPFHMKLSVMGEMFEERIEVMDED